MTRIRPQKFVHVVYRTRRFDAMLRWYTRVFDAKVQYRNPALAFLTYDDEHHRFAFANLAVLQPEGTETERSGVIGVDHVAYTCASLEDLFENDAQLKAQRILPYWCVTTGWRCRCTTPIRTATRWSSRWTALLRTRRPMPSWRARISPRTRLAWSTTRRTGLQGCVQGRRPRTSCAGG